MILRAFGERSGVAGGGGGGGSPREIRASEILPGFASAARNSKISRMGLPLAGQAARSSARKRGRGGEIERNNVRDVPFVPTDFSRPCTPGHPRRVRG